MLERRAAAKLQAQNAVDLEQERKRDGIQLQRTRVLREIKSARNERHRQTLEIGLKFLDDQLNGLR